ncbi:MAG: HAD family phosphatase [Vicinamibacterales bacterium]|nr:HAD family phosphatase [Vicinamibacterales bacterium]
MTTPRAKSPEPEATRVKLLLFDLGGVLVDWAGPRELGQYLRAPSTQDEVLRRWLACPHTDALERGVLSPSEWAERFVDDWGVTLAPVEFLTVFQTWVRGVLPGARELLDSLRPRFRLAALSNSNALHWDQTIRDLKILDLFEFAISSHQVGRCKPEPEIFETALERAALPADEIMFFDDLAANVEAARSLGIRACQVNGVDGVRRCLETEGLTRASSE